LPGQGHPASCSTPEADRKQVRVLHGEPQANGLAGELAQVRAGMINKEMAAFIVLFLGEEWPQARPP
jgi:hypothetical protein